MGSPLQVNPFLKQSKTVLEQFLISVCGAQLDELLAETQSAEARHKIILNEFQTRPDWAEVFLKKVNSSRGGDEPLELDPCIRRAGIENVKSLLIIRKLAETIPSKTLETDPSTGQFLISPTQILNFSKKAHDIFGSDGPHKDIIFAAGLIFDIIELLISIYPDAGLRKKLSDSLKEQFTEATKITQIAIQLGRGSKRLALEKHIVSLIFIHQASFIPMTMAFPSYLGFLKDSKKQGIPTSAQNLLEMNSYGGTHHLFAATLSWPFQIFSNLTEGLLNFDTPHLVSTLDSTDLYDITAIAHLAAFLKINQAKYQKSKQKLLAKDIRPELSQLDLTIDPDLLFGKKG